MVFIPFSNLYALQKKRQLTSILDNMVQFHQFFSCFQLFGRPEIYVLISIFLPKSFHLWIRHIFAASVLLNA